MLYLAVAGQRQAESCAGVRVQEPSALRMPADSVAPAGTPVIFTVRTASASASPSAAWIGKAMALSSLPDTVAVVPLPPSVSVGASATGVTSTWTVPEVEAAVAALPPSTVVAVTVRSKCCVSPSLVSFRPESCAGVRVQEPSALWMPADSVAPAGTPVIFTLRTASASASPSATLIEGKAMAVSSLPDMVAPPIVSAGASATGVDGESHLPGSRSPRRARLRWHGLSR